MDPLSMPPKRRPAPLPADDLFATAAPDVAAAAEQGKALTVRAAEALAAGEAGKQAAAHTDDMARLWRDGEAILRRELPKKFTVADIRMILQMHGLIANDGKEKLDGLAAWGRRFGTATSERRRSHHLVTHGNLNTVYERHD